MQQTEFARATSLMAKARGQEEVAKALGVQPQTYRQMRTQPGGRHYRRPPSDWKVRLGPLARAAAAWYRASAADVEASVLEDLDGSHD